MFVPITPCRLADTRPAPSTVGARSTPLAAGEVATFVVHGSQGNSAIPSGASAISANVTITAPTSDGFLTMFPADASLPNASNVNWTAGQAPTPNAVTVDLSADGSVKVFNERGTVNVIIDIVGYFEDHDHDDRYYTKAQINGLPSSSVVAGGAVASDGTVNTTFPRFGSAWTVTRNSAGAYTLAMPGLNPGCLSPSLPLVLLTVTDLSFAGMAQVSGFGVITCATGNTTMQIETYDDGGSSSPIAGSSSSPTDRGTGRSFRRRTAPARPSARSSRHRRRVHLIARAS